MSFVVNIRTYTNSAFKDENSIATTYIVFFKLPMLTDLKHLSCKKHQRLIIDKESIPFSYFLCDLLKINVGKYITSNIS